VIYVDTRAASLLCSNEKYLQLTDGNLANMGPEVYDNINVIAGTLKLYLRLLPVPLVTFETHPALIKAARKLMFFEEIEKLLCYCIMAFWDVYMQHIMQRVF
jgi:hypothetical protein